MQATSGKSCWSIWNTQGVLNMLPNGKWLACFSPPVGVYVNSRLLTSPAFLKLTTFPRSNPHSHSACTVDTYKYVSDMIFRVNRTTLSPITMTIQSPYNTSKFAWLLNYLRWWFPIIICYYARPLGQEQYFCDDFISRSNGMNISHSVLFFHNILFNVR